ncbi:MAG: ATP-binding protein [Colwellia sp.]
MTTLWCVFQDSDGDIWLCTDKQGVSIYDAEIDGFHHIPSVMNNIDNDRFPMTAINDIYEDKQGSFWFATSAGLKRISPHLDRFDVIKKNNTQNSLHFNNVLSIFQDSKNNIWFATDGGGVDKYNPSTKEFKHYQHDQNNINSLTSDSVIAITEDKENNMWFGTYAGGLNKLNVITEQFSHFQHQPDKPFSDSLAKNDIFKVYIDEKQRVWISVWRMGLQIYDPDTDKFTSYFRGGIGGESGISNFEITDIKPTGDGSYWIAGFKGLERFVPEENKFYKIEIAGLDRVNNIFVDDHAIVWLATSTGLIRYNSKTNESELFTTKHGLSENFVVSIEKDQQGNLWLGTRLGLNQFNPLTHEFRVFTIGEGLVSNIFNRFSHLLANDGTMYFGGPDGINVFDPMNLPINNHIPNIIISDIKLHQQSIAMSSIEGTTSPFRFLQALNLNFNDNDLEFEFSALDFISPQNNHYRYRLRGFDENWHEVDSNGRRVRFINLSPGTYRFEVKGSNSEGTWNNVGTGVDIVIFPPWWQTWWAYTLFVLMTLVLLYLYNYWKGVKSLQAAKLLEQQVNERTQQLTLANVELEKAIKNLKTTQNQLVESEKMASLGELVAGVAHEINTPIGICLMAISSIQDTSISLFAKFENNTLSSKDFFNFQTKLTTGLELSLSNIYRASELISSFKQVAVEQSSELLHSFNLKSILKDSINTITPQTKSRHIHIHLNCAEDIFVTSYPGAVSQIIINFIINSITHGFKKESDGQINISVELLNSDKFILCYRDNGQGINDQYLDKIFDPFFTTNRKGGNTGLGMHIVYNLVTQQLKGEIKVNSLNQGVEFTLIVPLNA